MAKGAVLSLKITGDASGAKAAFDDAESSSGKFGDGLGKLAGIAAGAFAVDKILDFAGAAFDAASNLEQMAGSVDAVFGESSAKVQALAENAANAVGLSTASYDQMASVIGSQLKNAGVPAGQLADKVDGLIQKGADMSAVFGGTAADAVDALSGVMKGEFDPIEKYGVSINQTAINAALAAKGQDKLTGSALKQAQVAAALELVTKQTADTTGQFAKQGDTAAEKSQKLGAWFDNLKAKVGGGMLPIFVTLTSFFSDKVAPALDDLFRKGGPVATVFATIGDFVTTQLMPALGDLWSWLSANLLPVWGEIWHVISADVVPAFQLIWSYVTDYVIPVFKAELGPALSGIKDAWHTVADAIDRNKGKVVEFYDNLKPFLDFIKNDVAPIVGGTLKDAFKGAGDIIGWVIDKIGWVLDKGAAIGHFIGGLFGAPASTGGGGAVRGAAPLRGASRASGGLLAAAGSLGGGGAGPSAAAGGLTVAGGTTINVTVNGALDPVAVGRQISDVLRTYARQTGSAVAVTL